MTKTTEQTHIQLEHRQKRHYSPYLNTWPTHLHLTFCSIWTKITVSTWMD